MSGFPSRDERCLTAVEAVILAHGLPLRVIKKDSSPLMRAIGVVFTPFNPQFMKGYATTIPPLGRIYVPNAWYEKGWWRSLAHEGQHLEQANRRGQVRFALKYLFPQWLGALSLLAFGAFAWMPMLWCLLFLVALIPWPAPWRVQYEREAFIVTAACDKMLGIDITTPLYLEYMMKHYVRWGYYRPRWRRAELERGVKLDLLYATHIVDVAIPGALGNGPYCWHIVRAVKGALEAK